MHIVEEISGKVCFNASNGNKGCKIQLFKYIDVKYCQSFLLYSTKCERINEATIITFQGFK